MNTVIVASEILWKLRILMGKERCCSYRQIAFASIRLLEKIDSPFSHNSALLLEPTAHEE